MINSVVFDFDGTLVDSNGIKHRSFFEVARHIAGARPVIAEALADPGFGDRYAVFRYLAERLAGQGQTVDSESLVEHYTRLCEEKIIGAAEIPGATSTLTDLAGAGIRMAISSATPQNTLRKIVAGRGWRSYFTAVMGTPDTKEQHLEKVFGKWNLSPAETLYVGDSEADRSAARNMGCKFVGIGDGTRFREQPEIRLSSLVGLPGMSMSYPADPRDTPKRMAENH